LSAPTREKNVLFHQTGKKKKQNRIRIRAVERVYRCGSVPSPVYPGYNFFEIAKASAPIGEKLIYSYGSVRLVLVENDFIFSKKNSTLCAPAFLDLFLSRVPKTLLSLRGCRQKFPNFGGPAQGW
jgi:hypothetical protein